MVRPARGHSSNSRIRTSLLPLSAPVESAGARRSSVLSRRWHVTRVRTQPLRHGKAGALRNERFVVAVLAAAILAACGPEVAPQPHGIEYATPTPTAAAPTREYSPPVVLTDIIFTEPAPAPRAEPTPAPAPVVAAGTAVRAIPLAPPVGDMGSWLAAAGVPDDLRPAFAAIGECESHGRADAVGDHGASLGWLQLNAGWFRAGEDAFDPVVNASVGYRLRLARGRFGGPGGWTCADLLGIP